MTSCLRYNYREHHLINEHGNDRCKVLRFSKPGPVSCLNYLDPMSTQYSTKPHYMLPGPAATYHSSSLPGHFSHHQFVVINHRQNNNNNKHLRCGNRKGLRGRKQLPCVNTFQAVIRCHAVEGTLLMQHSKHNMSSASPHKKALIC